MYPKMTKEEFVEKVNRHGAALNVDIIGEFTGVCNKILIKCLLCGTESYVFPCNLYHSRCCQKCALESMTKKARKKDIIYNERPDLVDLMYDKSDSYSYTSGCNKKIDWKCPSCNFVFSRSPYKISTRGFNCPRCGRGISWGERIINAILEVLGVDFKREKVFDWAISEFNKNYFYDFYIQSHSAIIEVMGLQHEKEVPFYKTSLEEQIRIDGIKESLAKENGIQHYIKIRYDESGFDNFFSEVLKSDLSKLFKMDTIDICDVKKKSYINSEFKLCVDSFNNKSQCVRKMSETLNIHPNKIKQYLKIAGEIGLCDYNDDIAKFLAKDSVKQGNYGKRISQYDMNGAFIAEYKNCYAAAKEVGGSACAIQCCVRRKNKTSNGYIWRRSDDVSPTKEELEEAMPKPSVNRVSVYQYDFSGNFVRAYCSVSEAKTITGISDISSAANGNKKTAGGYIWRKFRVERLSNLEINKSLEKDYSTWEKVVQYSVDGKFIAEFPSVAEAKRKTGLSSISGVLCGKGKTAGGYIWKKYSSGDLTLQEIFRANDDTPHHCKAIVQCSKDGLIIKNYPTIMSAKLETGIMDISDCLHGRRETAGGYIWKYKEKQ